MGEIPLWATTVEIEALTHPHYVSYTVNFNGPYGNNLKTYYL
jgi:hypothetical protein